MDDIEYLEEYEDLIMPGVSSGAVPAAAIADDESSSSIDQDIFESLFDNQSEDENEVLPPKSVQRQERESLDSLDMLVRDLGEQVSIQNEQQKPHNNGSAQNSLPAKPMAPCLKKNTHGNIFRDSMQAHELSSPQEKTQKRVMFAKLPSVKCALSTLPSTSRKIREYPEQHTILGRKPISTAYDSPKMNDSNSQRKLNRPQLTIVRPEKIQFKDPVDDPLSLDKIESDLESISDDSIVSLSDIFSTYKADENEDENVNMDCSEIQPEGNSEFLQPLPAHISTENLPEKVTIISDTVLTRIDTAILESLATDESKEAFSKDPKTQDKTPDSKKADLKLVENVQTKSSIASESNNEGNDDIKNANTTCGNIVSTALVETSLVDSQINKESFTKETGNSKDNNTDVKNNNSNDIVDKQNFKHTEKLSEKSVDISKDEILKEPDINSNTSDNNKTTGSKEDHIELSVTNESNIATIDKNTPEAQGQQNTPQESTIGSRKSVSKEISKAKIESSQNSQANSKKLQKKTESIEAETKKHEKTNLKTPKEEENISKINSKPTPKKLNTSVKPETQIDNQKIQQSKIDTKHKSNTPSQKLENTNPISTQSRPEEQRKDIPKEMSNARTNKSEKNIAKLHKNQNKVTAVKADQNSVIKPEKVSELKDETTPASKRDDKKSIQESGSIKEKELNNTSSKKQKIETKESITRPSSSTVSTSIKDKKENIDKKESATMASSSSTSASVKNMNKSTQQIGKNNSEIAPSSTLSCSTKEKNTSTTKSKTEKKESTISPSTSTVLCSTKEKDTNTAKAKADKKESSINTSSSTVLSSIKEKDSSKTKSKVEKKEPNVNSSLSTVSVSSKEKDTSTAKLKAEKKEATINPSTSAVSGSTKEKDTITAKPKVDKKESSINTSSSTVLSSTKGSDSSTAKPKVEKKEPTNASTSSRSKNQHSENNSGEVSSLKRESSFVEKSSSHETKKLVIPRKSHSSDDIKKQTQLLRQGSNISTSSVEKSRNSINLKGKQDSSGQKQINTKIHKGDVDIKKSTSTNTKDNQEEKKEKIKDQHPKNLKDSQDKKDSPEKKDLNKKSGDVKKSVISNAKEDKSKTPKDAETSKRKVSQAETKGDKSGIVDSKQHADKIIKPPLSEAVKETAPSKKEVTPQNERTPISSSVKKNLVRSTSNLTPNTSIDKSKRKAEGHTLKRENTMNTTESSSAKRLKVTSSPIENISTTSTSNECNLSTKSKTEKTIENAKPSNISEEKNLPKVTNKINSENSIKLKDDANRDANQSNVSKTPQKDQEKTSTKKVEISTKSKTTLTTISKEDKSKTENKLASSVLNSSLSSNNSTAGSTKVEEKSNAKDVTIKPIETATPVKKSTGNVTPKNSQLKSKPPVTTKTNKSEINEGYLTDTPSLSSDNKTFKDKKTDDVSVTSGSVTDKIALNSLQSKVYAGDNTKEENQPTKQTVLSVFAEDTNNLKPEVSKSVPLNNKQNLRSSENTSNKVQNTKEQITKNTLKTSDKKQRSNKGTTSSQCKIEAENQKDFITDNISPQDQCKESKTLEIKDTGSKTSDQIERPPDLELHNAQKNVNANSENTAERSSVELEKDNIPISKPETVQRNKRNKKDIPRSKQQKKPLNSPPTSTAEKIETQRIKEMEKQSVSDNSTKTATESSVDTKEFQDKESVPMDVTSKRKMHKSGSETKTIDNLHSPAPKALTIDKAAESVESLSCSEPTTENVTVEKVDKPARKSSRKRKTKSHRMDLEVEKTKKSDEATSGSQQEDIKASNRDMLKEQGAPLDKNTQSTDSQPGEEHSALVLSNVESMEPAALPMEEGSEQLLDSKLDNVSITSVESAAFSGFADSPTNVIGYTITSLSDDKNTLEKTSVSPKRAKTAPSFKEWLERKKTGKSLQKSTTQTRNEVVSTEKDDEKNEAKKDQKNTESQTDILHEEKGQINEKSDTELPSKVSETPQTTTARVKSNSKPPKPKKSEIAVLKESMSKEMLESGIDKLIESHFSSPHCLTKRSIATATRSTPTVKFFANDLNSSTPVPTVNTSNKKNVQKDLKRIVKPNQYSCKNFRIRLNRSVVKNYLKNLNTQASTTINNVETQQTEQLPIVQADSMQDLSRRKKRKALTHSNEPQTKKPTTATTIKQLGGKKTTASRNQKQSQPVRSTNSNNAMATMTSTRSRGACTPSVLYDPTTVKPTISPQTADSSPSTTSHENMVTEANLLTPMSEVVTPVTPTDISRRVRQRRFLGNTTTTVANSGRLSEVRGPIISTTSQTQPTQNLNAKKSVPLATTDALSHADLTPKTECEDDYNSEYQTGSEETLQSNQTPILPPGPSSTVPLVISGATSHSLPPIVIDNAGTRIYSFLHPTKYSNSHGYVMLDYCCPNLDGPMTAIDPTRRHAKIDAVVRELPAYITMETRLITRAELEADSNALPASIRHKVQRITASNKSTSSQVTNNIPETTSSMVSTNMTSCNFTSTTTVPPKVTTALVSALTTSSTSIPSSSSTVSASVSALQKQLPSTTTLTPKTVPSNVATAVSKKIPANGKSVMAMSSVAPTATITPTTLNDMRTRLRANLKNFDILLKKHYPRISLLTFQQRQEIIESVASNTQLLPRDIESATKLMQEYATHMALKTAAKPQMTLESSASSKASTTIRTTSSITAANTSTLNNSKIYQTPPITTRALAKRNSTMPSTMQRRSVPIYSSDKTVIGYQVQTITSTDPGNDISTANPSGFTTSASATRRYTRTNASASTSLSSSMMAPRSGVFMIDNGNVNAPATSLMPVSNNITPRMLYKNSDPHTPTTVGTIVTTPQASSTPLSSSGSIVTRSGGTVARIGNRGMTMRQVPTRAATARIQAKTAPTTSTSPLPRLPPLLRNPHLPPISTQNQSGTPIRDVRHTAATTVVATPAAGDLEQKILQKRLTRKTAATNVSELVVVNHDSQGNPLPPTEEAILPDENSTTSSTHIKREKPDEFPTM